MTDRERFAERRPQVIDVQEAARFAGLDGKPAPLVPQYTMRAVAARRSPPTLRHRPRRARGTSRPIHALRRVAATLVRRDPRIREGTTRTCDATTEPVGDYLLSALGAVNLTRWP